MAKNKTILINGNPSVMMREARGGEILSLRLRYYLGLVEGATQFKYEKLDLWLWNKKHLSPSESEHNRETKETAKAIRETREKELLKKTHGYIYAADRNKINFYEWFEDYIRDYDKADIRVVEMALRRFRSFIAESRKYAIFKDKITPDQLTPEIVTAFVKRLEKDCTGSGAQSIYKRFKKVIRAAVKQNIFIENPCEDISAHSDNDGKLIKDVLTAEEIEKLIHCKFENQSDDVRRAFIFCLFTGLRFCDVKVLRYGSIDRENKELTIRQAKTKKLVSIPLRDDVLTIIGNGEPNELVFHLGSANGCNKSLRHWVEKAGINKHITWHCARHSFGANTYNNIKDLRATSELLGHSDTSITQVYTRVFDDRKREIVNSLPKIENID